MSEQLKDPTRSKLGSMLFFVAFAFSHYLKVCFFFPYFSPLFLDAESLLLYSCVVSRVRFGYVFALRLLLVEVDANAFFNVWDFRTRLFPVLRSLLLGRRSSVGGSGAVLRSGGWVRSRRGFILSQFEHGLMLGFPLVDSGLGSSVLLIFGFVVGDAVVPWDLVTATVRGFLP